MTVPADLKKALLGNTKAKVLWDGLTPIARRDFISWILSAKQKETRTRRVERACDMLLLGKRRPCCYALVPMNLYKALGAVPKAQTTWKTLTPDERRDFIDWVDSAKEGEERIGKVCSLLAKGKRRPV